MGEHGGDFRRRCRGRQQNIDAHRCVSLRRPLRRWHEPWMNFVRRPVRPDPGDKIHCRNTRCRRLVELRDEGIVRHILDQVHARQAQCRAPGRCQRAVELDEKQSARRDFGVPFGGHYGAIGAGIRIDEFIAQPDAFGLAGGAGLNDEQRGRGQPAKERKQTAEIHRQPILSLCGLGNAKLADCRVVFKTGNIIGSDWGRAVLVFAWGRVGRPARSDGHRGAGARRWMSCWCFSKPDRMPAAKYPRLAGAPQNQLEQVRLRRHGLALRWEELDEDIWVDDAVCGRFPRRKELAD